MTDLHRANAIRLAMLAALVATAASCKHDGDNGTGSVDDFVPTLGIEVCDPSAGPFSLDIDNPFFPLPVGQKLILDGEEDGAALHVEITVLDEAEDVAGVTTRVVEERETEDGELVEVSRNFFAQAPDGTVCYFGEDVTDYEDGTPVPADDQWRAGVDGALPGIIMPAAPAVGLRYLQEVAPGVAEDRGEIIAVGEDVSGPTGTYTDTVSVLEDTPLDDGFSTKTHARGIGLVRDEADDELLELTGRELSIAVCAADAGPFSLDITNPYMPLPVGHRLVLEGEEDGAALEVVITVLDETEDVAGVTTRVVEERESEDGELVEVSRNFFAQAPDGTVCYFGEDVTDYEDGVPTPGDDAWRAGVDGAQAGIIMPALPRVGDRFQQEMAPGVAEDRGEIAAAGEATTVPAGTFTDTLRVTESSPLDSGTSTKVHAAGVGLLVDDTIELTDYE